MSTIKISKMSGKLEGMSAINSDPLSNPFCRMMRKSLNPRVVCSYCYSCKMLKSYRKRCRAGWRANGLLMSLVDLRDDELPMITSAFCRIHAHGEIINERHMNNIFRIMEANEDIRFGFWTKRADLVAKAHDEGRIPRNTTMVYSNPMIDDVMTKPPKGFHKTFNVVTDEAAPNVNCAGKKCMECKLCYRRKTSKTIVEVLRGEDMITDLTEELEPLEEVFGHENENA